MNDSAMQPAHVQLIDQVEAIVHQRMSGQGAGHDMDHVLRVTRSAKQLQEQIGGNRLVVELAALLHDIGDAKFHDGVEKSAEFAAEILSQLDTPTEIIEHVCDIVDRISFRKGVDSETLSLEGKIVQDADRLDAIGAIGIVRTVEYGAVKGQPFYSTDPLITKTGIAHFDDKLFKLTGLMNTEPARRIAQGREQFMRAFVDQFKLECDHDGNAS
jgi:uncharacterized protein